MPLKTNKSTSVPGLGEITEERTSVRVAVFPKLATPVPRSLGAVLLVMVELVIVILPPKWL